MPQGRRAKHLVCAHLKIMQKKRGRNPDEYDFITQTLFTFFQFTVWIVGGISFKAA